MKIIALFLTIIVVTLTITPCCALEGSESHAHQTSQKENRECSEQDDDCCRDCSPFYACGTCAGFMLATRRLANIIAPIITVKHNTLYISAHLPLIPLAIWQPPKLS